jgi:TPR repeat protein
MAEQKRRFGFRDPNLENFNDDADRTQARPYAFGRSARTDRGKAGSVPLFLSDSEEPSDPDEQRYSDESYSEERYQDERYQDELYQEEPYAQGDDSFARGFANPLRKPRRATVSFRILMAVLAATGVAMLFALFSSDAARNFVESAKATITATSAVPPAEAESSTQLSAQDMQLKDPTRVTLPASPSADNSRHYPRVAMAPTRDEITSAYQSALQAPAAAPAAVVAPPMTAPPAAPQQVAALPPAAPPMAAPSAAAPATVSPPARRIDPDELALLMKRARDLLASGDIPPARLLLRRAADAQEPTAALLLAQTYDPQVLGTRDVRSINADLATARDWYQKAAQLGSVEAQRRLAQLQN